MTRILWGASPGGDSWEVSAAPLRWAMAPDRADLVVAGRREPEVPAAPPRRPLVVKPIFVYSTYTPASRRRVGGRWGGIETQEDADEEVARIKGELKKLQADGRLPRRVPARCRRFTTPAELAALKDVAEADVLLVYACQAAARSRPLASWART